MATRLTQDVGLQLLANSLATGAVLVALILTLQPVSAAFNPVVTMVEAVSGEISWRYAGVFVLAQVSGGILGTVVANAMFELDPGKRYEDWGLDDPAGQGIESVRVIRDQIRARVEELIGSLD